MWDLSLPPPNREKMAIATRDWKNSRFPRDSQAKHFAVTRK